MSLRSDIDQVIFLHEVNLTDGFKYYGTGTNVSDLVDDLMEVIRNNDTNEQKEKG